MSLVNKMMTPVVHSPLTDDWNLIFLEGKSFNKYHIHPHLPLVPNLLKCQCVEGHLAHCQTSHHPAYQTGRTKDTIAYLRDFVFFLFDRHRY